MNARVWGQLRYGFRGWEWWWVVSWGLSNYATFRSWHDAMWFARMVTLKFREGRR